MAKSLVFFIALYWLYVYVLLCAVDVHVVFGAVAAVVRDTAAVINACLFLGCHF